MCIPSLPQWTGTSNLSWHFLRHLGRKVGQSNTPGVCLCVHVLVFVCACVGVCVYMCGCLCVHVLVFVWACVGVCVYMCGFVCAPRVWYKLLVCMYVCLCVHVCMYECVWVCVWELKNWVSGTCSSSSWATRKLPVAIPSLLVLSIKISWYCLWCTNQSASCYKLLVIR